MGWMTLVGVVLGFALAQAREYHARRRDGLRRRTEVRRLLAHHAVTLVADANEFATTAAAFQDALDPEIAAAFSDVSTSDRVFRDEIARRVSNLSDELIDLFNDVDLADSSVTHAVDTLRLRASRFHQPAQPLPGGYTGIAQVPHPNNPRSLRLELDAVANSYAALREAAITTLARLRQENEDVETCDEIAHLPERARKLLAELDRTNAQLPPGSVS